MMKGLKSRVSRKKLHLGPKVLEHKSDPKGPRVSGDKINFIASLALCVRRAVVTQSVLFWTGNPGGSDQSVSLSDLRPLRTGRTKLTSSRRETAMISVMMLILILSS